MAEIACNGPCNYHWRQARSAYDQALNAYDPLDPQQSRPIPPQLIAVPGNPWCGGCQATIRRELLEIGDLASILSATADGHRTTAPGERVAGTRGHRTSSPEGDLVEELFSVLYGWECAWWKILSNVEHPPARRGFLADKVTCCILWIGDHFNGMITHADIAVPFGEEIRDWHRGLRSRTKAGTSVRHKPLRCPGHGCGQLSLTWREGEEYVRCISRDCGQMISIDEYEEYERKAAALPAAS